MFATSIKPDRAPSGISYLRQFVRDFPIVPHLAIGGITVDSIAELRQAGAQGIAVSSAICAADDPGKVVRNMLIELSSPKLSCCNDGPRC
jgi:thiamine monophosphate synthase